MAEEKSTAQAARAEPALDPHAQMVGNSPVDYASSHDDSISESGVDPEKHYDEKHEPITNVGTKSSLHHAITTSTQQSALSTESQTPTDPPRRWYNYLNPLKWGRPPPVPKERTVCPEYGANWFSRLFFIWMGPMMTTGYRRTLQLSDIPLVNPDRSMNVLADRLLDSFRRRAKRGDRYPLLWAANETVRNEFWIGGACALISSMMQIFSPFVLRYLIAFARDAYAASNGVGEAPPLGHGLGLVFGISIMQVLQSLSTGHFIYRGFMVGAEIRAALIVAIFEKAMRISARAKAGGAAPVDPATTAEEREKLARTKRNLLEKMLDRNASKGTGSSGGSAADQGYPNGTIVNLMSTDTYRIYEASGMFHMIWTSPVMILVCLAVLLVNLTYSALAGFALLVIGVPLLTKAIKMLLLRRRAISKVTDTRVALTQEVLQAVRFVKLFGWEAAFLERINQIRRREISAIQVVLTIRNAILSVSMSLPVFASMLSFVTFALSNHVLDPAPVFSSLALFNALRMPLNLLPMIIGQVTDAWASLGRIQDFLSAEEQGDDIEWDMDNKDAVVVRGARFTWERSAKQESEAPSKGKGGPTLASGKSGPEPMQKSKWWKRSARKKGPNVSIETNEKQGSGDDSSSTTKLEPFQLHDVNLSVGRSELLAVIGTVGSGKSSLLAALAGDMRRTDGAITIGAARAFCPQYAWIQNTSLRDNILFGREMDQQWYDRVVEACALRPDLEMLPAGDLTEIGERGITLSGGQKQRLNIARAVYGRRPLVLLDDPLSAVDAHVGRHIFDHAITGLLNDTCRILATHQLHVLQRCDRVVVMEEGTIRTVDTFANLMAHDEGFREMMAATAQEEKQDEESESEEALENGKREEAKKGVERRKKAKKAVALMQEEDRAVRSVSWSVYAAYIRGSGSLLNAPLVLFLLIISQCANIATSLWLSYWTANTFGYSMGVYIGVYAALAASQAILMFAYTVSVAIFGTRASKIMMRQAMACVLRAPMSFFDTTPLGRIMNRFSKDLDTMDNSLTEAVRMFSLTICMIVSVFVLIAVFFPYFLVALGPLLVAFVASANYYRASAREVKRLESLQRSHVFARFGEGVSGVASIRAYGLQQHFSQELRGTVDEMNAAYYLTFSNQRWLSVRLDAVAYLLVLVTGILVVTNRFSISPSIAGLVLSYILSIVQMMQFSVRQLAEVENAMNSTERVHHYGTRLEQEAAPHVPPGVAPTWPEKGAIDFEDVQMRYRPGLPLVLQGFDLRVRGGERVAIVGRTCAGKSSVLSALFRLVEPSGGSILIDGVDIAKIGLHGLRDRLAIIPQDPTLFKGTVRSNLDPFGRHTDLELWNALRQAGLVDEADEKLEGTADAGAPGGARGRVHLDAPVDEEGLNFSLGQRQLLALARALARGCRVLLADEATSSIDPATDAKVQTTIKNAFKGCTLICIAHRLRTIVGYDRVCVLDHGQIVELGPPRELWGRKGVFWGMCERSGIVEGDFGKED